MADFQTKKESRRSHFHTSDRYKWTLLGLKINLNTPCPQQGKKQRNRSKPMSPNYSNEKDMQHQNRFQSLSLEWWKPDKSTSRVTKHTTSTTRRSVWKTQRKRSQDVHPNESSQSLSDSDEAMHHSQWSPGGLNSRREKPT